MSEADEQTPIVNKNGIDQWHELSSRGEVTAASLGRLIRQSKTGNRPLHPLIPTPKGAKPLAGRGIKRASFVGETLSRLPIFHHHLRVPGMCECAEGLDMELSATDALSSSAKHPPFGSVRSFLVRPLPRVVALDK